MENQGQPVSRSSPTPGHQGYAVEMGAPEDIPVMVARSPYTTVLESLLRAAGSGSPLDDHTTAITRTLSAPARDAMQAFRSSVVTRRLPDIAAVAGTTLAEPVADHIGRLGDLRAGDIAESLEDFWDTDMPHAWRRVHDSPKLWTQSMQAAVADAWRVTRPRWAGAESALDREARRIGLAVVTGGVDTVLNSIHPRLRFQDGTLTLKHSFEQTNKRGDRRLVLVPMLAGPDQIIVNFELPDVIYVGYPLNEAPPVNETRPDTLALLLGPIRATAARILTQPMTMTQLAAKLHCAPSTATYHCDSLEASGLVVRNRSGQGVWVSRTARADMLIDLLSSQSI